MRRTPSRLCNVTVVALIFLGAMARADDVPNYCPELRQVAAAAVGRDRFASIIGAPRAGNYLETNVVLPGWQDCAFYGTRTYTCDSHGFRTVGEGDRAFTNTVGGVGACLRDGWAEDPSRASPGYVVFHDTRQVAAITINTAQSDKGEHIVRLILFLRSR
jgi:hypothetical protein